MDSLLAELHRAMVTQACLSNTTAILSLHLRHLAHQLQASPGGPRKCRGAGGCFLAHILAHERANHNYWLLLRLILDGTPPPLAVTVLALAGQPGLPDEAAG